MQEPHHILLHLQTFLVIGLDYIYLSFYHLVGFGSRIYCKIKESDQEKGSSMTSVYFWALSSTKQSSGKHNFIMLFFGKFKIQEDFF